MKATPGRELLILLCVMVLLPAAGLAGTVTLQFLDTNTFTAGSPAAVPGCTVCLTVKLTDVSENEIVLELESFLGSGQKVLANGGFFFNFDPDKDVSLLSFSLVDSNTSYGAASAGLGDDDYQAGGGPLFDINLRWSAPKNAVFLNGAYQKYSITNTQGLAIDDLLFLSVPEDGAWGPYYAAVHIGGITDPSCPSPDGKCSAWLYATRESGPPVLDLDLDNPTDLPEAHAPEPGTMLLLGSGLAAMAGMIRRRMSRV